MLIDKATLIGGTHLLHMSPSEDYADFRTTPEKTRLVLADGCSDGIQSDLAARDIVQLALDHMDEPVNLPQLAQIQLAANRVIHKHLATLLVADIFADTVDVSVTGDGAYGIMYSQDNNTFFEVNIIDYSHNQPEYPVYHAHPTLLSKWLEQGIAANATKTKSVYRWRLGDNAALAETAVLPLSGQSSVSYDKAHIEGIFLMSDGVASFKDKNIETVLTEMFQFKNLRGPFLVRRYRMAKLHEAPHHDDFTVIAAHWKDI